MVNTRGERRAAERAARELIAGKVTFIGDIGEVAAARTAAQTGVDEARDRARQLVEEARREGDRLVADARAKVTDADTRYAEAFDRAVSEGWSAHLLTSLGHPAPIRAPRRARGSIVVVDRTESVPRVAV
jgi:hypothetical protein